MSPILLKDIEVFNGSRRHKADPGEPSTGDPRLSITDDEAQILSYLAIGRRVLELGTGLGVSTAALALWGTSLTTVDIDPWVEQTIVPTLPANVTFSNDREQLDGEWDLVFIDADHHTEAVIEDVTFARAHCSGLIVCHDANHAKVRDALGDGWVFLPTEHGLALTLT